MPIEIGDISFESTQNMQHFGNYKLPAQTKEKTGYGNYNFVTIFCGFAP